MKVLVKKVCLLSVLTVFTVVVSAQNDEKQREKRSVEGMAEKQTEVMTEKLMLNPEQAAKIKEINHSYTKKMKQTRNETRENNKKARESFKSDMEAKDAEFQKVLTPEQYQQWKDLKKEKKKEIKEEKKKHKNKAEFKKKDKRTTID